MFYGNLRFKMLNTGTLRDTNMHKPIFRVGRMAVVTSATARLSHPFLYLDRGIILLGMFRFY